MGVWLIQTGQARAHLYPDDDNETRAACGHVLDEDCECCGRTLETIPWPNADKCPICVTEEK